MHIYKLLDVIRKRPGFFIDGDKSIRRLKSFLTGYEGGSYGTKNELRGQYDFISFNDWFADRLGYSSSVAGWCNMILWKAKSDEKAFNLFFELLDQFKSEGSPKSEHTKALIKLNLGKRSRKPAAKRVKTSKK